MLEWIFMKFMLNVAQYSGESKTGDKWIRNMETIVEMKNVRSYALVHPDCSDLFFCITTKNMGWIIYYGVK